MKDYLEPREWKLRSEIGPTQEGNPSSKVDQLLPQLMKETGLSPIALRVCVMRGLETSQAIQDFFFPKFEALKNPMTIRGMGRAVVRLSEARANQEAVRIFGDYDVDGTTGAALLSWVFRDFGFRHDARQPDRFKDGYGLNAHAVEEAVQAGVRVLVTVDCGITSFEAARRAQELGLDVIILDHHQIDPEKGLPPALAIVNPQRPDCESGLKQLCGCGLAFYLAMALRSRGRQEGWFSSGSEPNLKQHLDLVVMATAADMVPLTGDNRILVAYGLDVLRRTKKPGVKALLDAAGLGEKDLSPGHLGFVLGPRINASGRMQSAGLALELLTTMDTSRATQLAFELEQLNSERAEVQNMIWDEVRKRVERGIEQGRFKNGIVVADPSWHEGVVGIVASRVSETFRRPAAVISLREDFGKGSVRSFGGKDVLAALRCASTSLRSFGGHRHAAGLTVALNQLAAFEEAFDFALAGIAEDANARPLLIEGTCSIKDLDVATLRELERLGPFGPGNPEPVFICRASVQSHRILKGRHLKLSLTSTGSPGNPAEPEQSLDAIWFHAAERKDVLEGGLFEAEAEFAGVPELNRFRGRVTPTFRVRDFRRAVQPPGENTPS